MLPIIKLSRSGQIRGALLTFLPDRSTEAYNLISAMEPDEHYYWQDVEVCGALFSGGWFSSARRHIPPVTCKSYSGFQFSPDGSRLVFKDETNDMLKPVFIALPVIKDSPIFPGEPLYPGRLMTKDATPA